MFLGLILSQSSTQAQFEYKQFFNDNKIHFGYGAVILALLCGGYYMHSNHKKERNHFLTTRNAQNNLIEVQNAGIKNLEAKNKGLKEENEEQAKIISDLKKENSEMKQDVEDYQSINDRRTKNKDGKWAIHTYYNDTSIILGFETNDQQQTNYLKETIKKNKDAGKIPKKE